MPKPKLIIILGPTAAGKSSLGLELALSCEGEIVSADSVQVYRGLDIGSAKPSVEDRRRVRHHLVDILDPDQEYSAALFRDQADRIIADLHRRNTPIFVAGGTGLYLKVLTRGLFAGPGSNPDFRAEVCRRAQAEGPAEIHNELRALDPEAASRIHPNDLFRIVRALEVVKGSGNPISCFQREHSFRENPYDVLKVGLALERTELYRRIDSRVDDMLACGWLDEVKSLLARGYSPELKSLQSLGYKHLVSVLAAGMDLPAAVELIKRETRRYAKRQLTWFRNDPEIHWLRPAAFEEAVGLTDRFLAGVEKLPQ